MGRSAKVHKRLKKTVSTAQPKTVAQTPSAPVQSAKRRAGRKSKARAKSGSQEGEHVLGGADYVTLLLGGRRKVAAEALKLGVD